MNGRGDKALVIKQSLTSLQDWYASQDKKERAAIISFCIALLSYLINPIPLKIVGVAACYGFAAVVITNALAKVKEGAFLKPIPLLLFIATFAYLRSYPFNPFHLRFWAFIVCFYSTMICVILMTSSVLYKR